MEPNTKQLEARVKKLEDLLLGISNDPRFQAKVRDQIFDGEHTTGKPTIVNKNGKRYKVQIV